MGLFKRKRKLVNSPMKEHEEKNNFKQILYNLLHWNTNISTSESSNIKSVHPTSKTGVSTSSGTIKTTLFKQDKLESVPFDLQNLKLRIAGTSIVKSSKVLKKPQVVYHVLIVDTSAENWIINCTFDEFIHLRHTLKQLMKGTLECITINTMEYKAITKCFTMIQKLSFPKRRVFRSELDHLIIKGRCVELEYYIINLLKEINMLLKISSIDSSFRSTLQKIMIEFLNNPQGDQQTLQSYKKKSPPQHILHGTTHQRRRNNTFVNSKSTYSVIQRPRGNSCVAWNENSSIEEAKTSIYQRCQSC